MDLVYVFLGAMPVLVFLGKRELLIKGESFRLILAISLALFCAGLTLHFTDVGRYSTSGALLAPLTTLGLFRLLRKVFVKLRKREPRETFLESEPGLGPDMLFNFVYFVFSFALLMLLAVGMERLAKAGW
jgi:hypothetical protein